MAAYAAAAGIEAHIFMPLDVPQSNYIECKAFGAKVTLVDGLISDCAKMVAARSPREGWFDVSTLKEPDHLIRRIPPVWDRGYARKQAHPIACTLPNPLYAVHIYVVRLPPVPTHFRR